MGLKQRPFSQTLTWVLTPNMSIKRSSIFKTTGVRYHLTADVLTGGKGDVWPCVLQLAGGLILGVALWLRHDPKTSNLLQLEFDGAQAPNTFYISTYLPLALTLMHLQM